MWRGCEDVDSNHLGHDTFTNINVHTHARTQSWNSHLFLRLSRHNSHRSAGETGGRRVVIYASGKATGRMCVLRHRGALLLPLAVNCGVGEASKNIIITIKETVGIRNLINSTSARQEAGGEPPGGEPGSRNHRWVGLCVAEAEVGGISQVLTRWAEISGRWPVLTRRAKVSNRGDFPFKGETVWEGAFLIKRAVFPFT